LLIAGIHFPLQFERINGGMPISAIKQQREAYKPLQITEPISSEIWGKLSAMYVNGSPLLVLYSGRPLI
jgi:hypothetical protein